MTIDAATPRFRDDEAAAVYCNALGDWRGRFEMFLISIPQLDLKRRLEE